MDGLSEVVVSSEDVKDKVISRLIWGRVGVSSAVEY